MLPRDGRNPANECHRLLIIHGRLVFVHLRQQRHVVVDDRVGDEPRAFVPDLLLGFGFDTKFPAVDKRDSPAQPMIRFPTIQCLLHALA